MRVFISSVIQGFEEFRNAAADGVGLLDHEEVIAEQFPALPNSPQSACLASVREADVLILILGERYGATQESGLSATHEEYNEARNCSIPVLVLIQEDIDPEPEQAHFIAAVRNWTAGSLSANFRTPHGLQNAVVRALRNLERTQEREPPGDEDALERVLARIDTTGVRSWSASEPTLVVAVAGGPKRQILRPSDLEDETLSEQIEQEARFGSYPLFYGTQGVTTSFDNNALILSHEQFNSTATTSLLVDEEGTVRVARAAFRRRKGDRFSIPSLIEEDLQGDIRASLGLVDGMLGRIDPSQSLNRVAITAAILGQTGFLPWRTRAERDASPNSVTMGSRYSDDPIRVHLNPPIRDRSELRGQAADMTAQDLTVLLRRIVKP